ncbi:hypothetical protein ACVWYN_002494 [Pedobacter sp. UYP24]
MINSFRVTFSLFAAFLLGCCNLCAQTANSGAKRPMILGVYAGNESASVKSFESWLGRPVQAVLGYTSGGKSGDWNRPDPGWQITMKEFLGGSGRRVLWSIPMAPDDGGAAANREIATGKHNELYKTWAAKILLSRAGDKDPIYVRTSWELGGEWFPWTKAAVEDPKAYQEAFAQFALSFHQVSGRFKMVWDFTSDRGPVEQWYPGNEAVDVISQDIYWSPEFSGESAEGALEWARNRSRGLDWMVDFAGKHKKPMAISEWGAPGADSVKLDGAKFIRLFTQWLNTHNIVYSTYWDGTEGSGYNGRVSDNKPQATADELKKFYTTAVK